MFRYVSFVIDQAYVKWLAEALNLSAQDAALYQNLIGFVILAAFTVFNGEYRTLESIPYHGGGAWLVPWVASCVISCFLSVLAYRTRRIVSSTSFAVIGNMCKIFTVLLNWLVWDTHCTPMGLVGLGICLLSVAHYEQAPLRRVKSETDHPEQELC